MVYKVLYQENPEEIPTRERTKSLYIEAESIREARQKLAGQSINVEFIQPLNEAHLAYEKKAKDFTLENV